MPYLEQQKLSEALMFCVDMGTTRTRVWLVEDGRIWSSGAADFGIRDTTRGMTREVMETNLRNLMKRLIVEAGDAGLTKRPVCIAAAGMITSPTGLRHLPHIQAPAGLRELGRSVEKAQFEIDEILPMYFVAGVATGDAQHGIEAILSSDLMRGEETLCVGLLAHHHIAAGSAVLNLGSHWKWIFIDEAGRIAKSRTSLTGEMIHVVQTQTLLASALPQDRPESLDAGWFDRGSAEAARSGLSRALFCVRLLEQSGATIPNQRLAFLYGAFLETEIRALLNTGLMAGLSSVCLIGAPSLAYAWARRLATEQIPHFVLSEQQRDLSYISGLQQILGLIVDSPPTKTGSLG
jgi:2-dehydro-3-deoxygalactonokinase